MGKQTSYFFKIGLLASLLVLGACRSSGEADDSAGEVADSRPPASTNTGSTPSQPSAEQIAREQALRTRVFYFDFDVSEFRPADRATLTFHARDLASDPNKRVRLEGHADERGTREYNLALGERRANGIRDFLIVNGASRSQIETVSYGEERPARSGTTEQAYQANRRVEIIDR
ncbi:MAG: peptidoglycan-associated lipoprotein Pal [Gammaproteobacteria bacterium]